MLVAVPLWVLARSAAATTAGAVAVGVVAGSWLVTRVLDVPDPLDPVLAVVLGSPERLALLLAVVALGVLARRRSAAPAVPDGVQDTTVPDPAARVPGA